jgi:uncharacterized protein
MASENIPMGTPQELLTGLCIGIAFGFLLGKGGLAGYDTVEGQLLLLDFTFIKVLLTAILTGMIGIFVLKRAGLVQIKKTDPSLGTHVVGGAIMGSGFALLGLGPATVLAAAGTGSLDALFGILGILAGAGIFASIVYPRIRDTILRAGPLSSGTLPEAFHIREGRVVLILAGLVVAVLLGLELRGI